MPIAQVARVVTPIAAHDLEIWEGKLEQAVAQDIHDLEAYPKLSVPVLGISGISTPFLKAFLGHYAQDATMIEFQATGHRIPEERPAETTEAILEFLGQP